MFNTPDPYLRILKADEIHRGKPECIFETEVHRNKKETEFDTIVMSMERFCCNNNYLTLFFEVWDHSKMKDNFIIGSTQCNVVTAMNSAKQGQKMDLLTKEGKKHGKLQIMKFEIVKGPS